MFQVIGVENRLHTSYAKHILTNKHLRQHIRLVRTIPTNAGVLIQWTTLHISPILLSNHSSVCITLTSHPRGLIPVANHFDQCVSRMFLQSQQPNAEMVFLSLDSVLLFYYNLSPQCPSLINFPENDESNSVSNAAILKLSAYYYVHSKRIPFMNIIHLLYEYF